MAGGGWIPKTANTVVTEQNSERINLDNWNPMKEDYECSVYNSYKPMSMVDVIKKFSDQPKISKPSNIDGVQIYVSNVPHKFIDKNKLKEIFDTVGDVVRIKFVTTDQDLPYSYAFIVYKTEIEAITAVKRFNGKQLDPDRKLKPLSVCISHSSKNSIPKSTITNNNSSLLDLDKKHSNDDNRQQCGRKEIQFQCNKCDQAGYCGSSSCRSNNEMAHKSICQSKDTTNTIKVPLTGTNKLQKSASLFEKLKNPSPNNTITRNITKKMDTLSDDSLSNCPNASTKKFIRIPDGEVENLIVTHIEEPNKFFCVIHNDVVEEKMINFTNFINSVSLESIKGVPKVGTLVVAPYENCLYRGVITKNSIDPSKLMVCVFFVDFGNREEIPFSSLKTCNHDHFINFHYQSIECRFKTMQQYTSFKNGSFIDGINFTAKIIGHEGRIHILDLDIMSKSLNEFTNIQQSTRVINSTFNQKIIDPIESQLELNDCDIPCVKQKKDSLEINNISTNICSMNPLSLSVGNEYRFTVTSINGFNFYINLADEFSKTLIHAVTNNLSLHNLNNFIGENISILQNTKCIYVLGDGSIHRCRLLYTIQDGSYLVYDVDNGNKSIVSIDSLYDMPPIYNQVNEQAILCTCDPDCMDQIKSLYKNREEAQLTVVNVEYTPVLKYVIKLIPIQKSGYLSNSDIISPKISSNDLISSSNDDTKKENDSNISQSHHIVEYCYNDNNNNNNNNNNETSIPTRHITLGSQFGALISHFNSNDDFYVHLFESGCTSDLNSVTIRLVNDFSSSALKDTPLKFKNDILPKGTPLVTICDEDNLYYRCEVLDNINDLNDKFPVLAIDFGKIITTSLDKCFRLDNSLLIYPKIGVNCVLDKYSLLTTEIDLQSFLDEDDQTVFTFLFKEYLPNGKYLVQLKGTDSNFDK